MYTTAATYGTEQNRMIFSEKSDHLGNVRAVVSDVRKPVDITGDIDDWTWTADVTDHFSYYPFGMLEPGRQKRLNTVNAGGYRFGFNSHEKDDEVFGVTGAFLSWGDYGYDSRIARRWQIDPQWQKLPGQSPYSVNNNNPIQYTDPDGEFGFIGAAIGAVVGATVGGIIEYGTQVASNIKEGGFSKKAFTDIDTKKIIGAAAKGAITGLAAGATGGGSLILTASVQAGASVVGGGVERAITGDEIVDGKEIAGDLAAGALGGAASSYVSKSIEATVTSTILSKKIAKSTLPKIAGSIGKLIGRQSEKLFKDNNKGVGTVNVEDIDAEGELKENAIIEIIPEKEIIITPPDEN